MGSLIQKIAPVIRHRLVIQTFLDLLKLVGLEVTPYYLTQESLAGQNPSPPKPFNEDCTVGFLGPEEMKSIVANPEYKYSEQELLEMLMEGKRCFGLNVQGQTASIMFCDFEECHFKPCRFPLKENEAYFFSAYTFRPFRGKNLAAYLRYECYRELEKMGRDIIYSITYRYVTPAIKFKQKLNAQFLTLCLFVELFGRYRRHWVLKEYKENPLGRRAIQTNKDLKAAK